MNRRRVVILSMLAGMLLSSPFVTGALAQGFDGDWSGQTAGGQPLSFRVQSDGIVALSFEFNVGCASGTIQVTLTPPRPITSSAFSISVTSSAPGSLSYTMSGTFTSPTTVSGDLSYTERGGFGVPCAGSGGAAWTASRQGAAPVPPVPSSVRLTPNGILFHPGQSVVVGLDVAHSASGVPADFYAGVILSDNRTVVWFTAPGVLGSATTFAPAQFVPMQAAPPGFSLTLPAFFQFTVPTGIAPGTYLLVAALVRQGAFQDNRIDPTDILVSDFKAITLTP